MARPKSLNPAETLTMAVDASLKQRLDLILFSETLGRIPHGAYKEFFDERLREFFSWRHQPLERFGFPSGFFVAGPKEMVEALVTRLEGFKA